MSIKLMSLVWDKPLPIARKMLLLSLADQANDAGQCWPELDDLAARCSMSRRTLFDCLRELEEAGLLTRIHRGQVGALKVIFQVNEDALRQQDLLGATAETVADAAGAKSAPVRNLHRRESRTGAKNSMDPVRNLHPIKQPKRSNPKGISGDARELNEPSGNPGELVQAADRVGQFEGHATPGKGPGVPTEAGRIAADLRRRGYRITSQHPDLLAAVAEGVTADEVAEFADLYPPTDPKSRGSPGYVLGAARRQRAENADRTTTAPPVPRGTHADSRRTGESAVDRAIRRAREIQERTGVDLGVG